MSMPPTLTGPRVTLWPVQLGDVAARLALGRDEGIVRMFADPAGLLPFTEASAVRWVEGIAASPHAWIVEHEGRLLGDVRLHDLDESDQRALLAIALLDRAKLGLGLGRETVRLVLRHAFDALRLHRVGLRVVAYNERAIRCYQACGFTEEGREREAARIGDARHDDVMMGVLAREFTWRPDAP